MQLLCVLYMEYGASTFLSLNLLQSVLGTPCLNANLFTVIQGRHQVYSKLLCTFTAIFIYL